ncbi:hypothetical protein B7494_g1029 [Chlorociboria aeruginascens]|nr:hypothetical protein B7494_g1029 [Chlorociboria aeruginascens]
MMIRRRQDADGAYQCDQKKPSCGQCMRIQQACAGYRNQLDLSFRNESRSVIEKAQAQRGKKRRLRREKNANVEASSTDPTSRSGEFSMQPPPGHPQDSLALSAFTMQPTAEESGTNYFVANFVAHRSGPSTGHFTYIHEFCRQHTLDNILKCSIVAVGLAGLANVSRSPELLIRARRAYASTLQQINAALSSPTEAVKDEVIMSIMVASIFENTTTLRVNSLLSWNKHINGAAALLKLRGPAQLASPIGRTILLQVSYHLILLCIQRKTRVPEYMRGLWQQARSYGDRATTPEWKLYNLVDEFSVFRASIADGTLQDPEIVLAMALKLDDELEVGFRDVPPGWGYRTVATPDAYGPIYIYKGSFDIYYNYFTAKTFNTARAYRLLLNETILQYSMPGSPQYRTAGTNISQLRSEILRSVPQHLGLTSLLSSSHSPANIQSDLSSILRRGDWIKPPAMAGYVLIWPLYVASRAADQEQREYILRCLRFVGKEMGILHGVVLASYIESVPVES